MSLSVSDTAGHDRAKYGDEIRSIADHSDRAIAIVLRPQFPYPLPSIPAVDFRKRAASAIIRRGSGSRSNVQRACRLYRPTRKPPGERHLHLLLAQRQDHRHSPQGSPAARGLVGMDGPAARSLADRQFHVRASARDPPLSTLAAE